MSLDRISVSARFMIVLLIGFTFQACISITSLLEFKRSLVQDRITEVKHLLDTAYSTVVFYHDLADKGVLTDAAARRAAADAVRAMHYDDGNYFFIWDLNGKGIAHGAKPALEGKTFINSAEAHDNPVVAYMVARLIEVAKSAKKEGVTEYRIPKNGQTIPLDKIAYSRLFEPWGWSVGTGAYVDDIDVAFRARALSLLMVFLGMMCVAGAATFVLGRDLALAMNRLTQRVAGVARGELDGDVPDIERADEVGVMARALLMLRDTSREAVELRLDQLTGLPTRKLLMDRLKQAKARSARSGNRVGLMLVDIDRFKEHNDAHGHDFGDKLLREVAARLTATVREGDTVARLGGDEFIVIVVDVGQSEQEAAAAVEAIGEKILSVIRQPFHSGELICRATASVGISLFMGDATSAEDLLKQADLAMYKSKNSGRDACTFFDSQMEATVKQRAMLERELRSALADGQFTIHYQPHVGPKGEIVGAEALLRWEHPRRGLVLPGDFIPLAEETGLILPLGSWVLERACEQLALWARRPQTADFKLAINVSALQLQQNGFVDQVLAVLGRTGANPSRLTLELTESQILHNVEEVIEKMADLKAAGVCFALDDFGTGYSSLYILKRLPLNQLKIDRSFVRNVLTDPNDAAIAGMIVALAQTLGLEVIAEGVETAAQRDFLANWGCRYYQGFFFSRAIPLAGFESLVQSDFEHRSVEVAL
jgi:diguanylate cyclase (GGDEF)-like protein